MVISPYIDPRIVQGDSAQRQLKFPLWLSLQTRQDPATVVDRPHVEKCLMGGLVRTLRAMKDHEIDVVVINTIFRTRIDIQLGQLDLLIAVEILSDLTELSLATLEWLSVGQIQALKVLLVLR